MQHLLIIPFLRRVTVDAMVFCYKYHKNEVDNILIDKAKKKPIDIRNINRKIKFHENLDIINNPKSKTDEFNKIKLFKNGWQAVGKIDSVKSKNS